MRIANSKFCPSTDQSINTLLHEYTLQRLYKLKEYIDINESYEMAYHKDDEEKNSKGRG